MIFRKQLINNNHNTIYQPNFQNETTQIRPQISNNDRINIIKKVEDL